MILRKEIDGYSVRVHFYVDGEVSLEWRDHAETEAALARGESHLMGFHDFTIPASVLLAGADLLKELQASNQEHGSQPFLQTVMNPNCWLCRGTGAVNNKDCRNCKYGGDICRRNGNMTAGGQLCCDLPDKHPGPHHDLELNLTWYGGYGGFDPTMDNPEPTDLPVNLSGTTTGRFPTSTKCKCSTSTIWAKGCQCGGS